MKKFSFFLLLLLVSLETHSAHACCPIRLSNFNFRQWFEDCFPFFRSNAQRKKLKKRLKKIPSLASNHLSETTKTTEEIVVQTAKLNEMIAKKMTRDLIFYENAINQEIKNSKKGSDLLQHQKDLLAIKYLRKMISPTMTHFEFFRDREKDLKNFHSLNAEESDTKKEIACLTRIFLEKKDQKLLRIEKSCYFPGEYDTIDPQFLRDFLEKKFKNTFGEPL